MLSYFGSVESHSIDGVLSLQRSHFRASSGGTANNGLSPLAAPPQHLWQLCCAR
jgi:hypothetical protein